MTRPDLEVIVRETTRIKKIVQGVLDFGRETPMQKTPQRIEKILDNTLEIIVHQERFFGITLIKKYGANLPPVMVDSSRLEQVFLNIIFNAVEAMKGSGTLTVHTRKISDWIEVDLTDTGTRDPRGDPGENLRSFLYHQGFHRRPGHGVRSGDQLWDH